MAVSTAQESDLDLINRLRNLYQVAANERKNYHGNWYRNYRLTMNIIGTWSSNVRQPSTRISEIYPALATIVSWMNDQHTAIDITAAADPGTQLNDFLQGVAQDLGDVIESNWEADGYNVEKKLVLWDALLYGAGFFKTIWDQSLAGGLGNPKSIHIDPFKLFIDPKATSLSDAEYIVERRLMSLAEIERRFPGHSIAVEGALFTTESDDGKPSYTNIDGMQTRTSPGNQFAGYSGGAFGSSAGTNIGSGAGSYTRWGSKSNRGPFSGYAQNIVVYEFWLRENEEWYEPDNPDQDKTRNTEPPDILTQKHVRDRWRVVVLAANEVLMDEYAEDLWHLGSHPYDRFVFDDVGEIYGVALVDHLAHPQVAINKLLLSLQQNAELTGNPIFMNPSNSGLGRTAVVNKPGQILPVNAAALQGGGKGPDWMKPPEPSQISMELIKFYLEQMDAITGLAPVQKSMSGSDRRSQDSVAMLQEVAFVRIRNALDNLEDTLKGVGQKQAELIIEFYTEQRYVAIVGQSGQKTSLVLRARHFNVPTEKGAEPLKYALSVTAGSQMPTSRQARASLANYAFGVGLLDRQGWYEAHQYPNWPDIDKRIKALEASGNWNPPGQRQRRQKSGGAGQVQ